MILIKTKNGIKQASFAEAKTNFNNFKGWYCGAGMDFLWISNKGDVFGNVCRKSGSYGNIFRDFDLPSEPIICPAETCYCASDINILKSKKIQDFKSLKMNSSFDLPRYKDEEILAVEGAVNEFAVNWNLGPRCNYDCSYCPSTVHDNHSPHISFTQFKQGFDALIFKIGSNHNFKFTFTGGEPTLNPEYIDIVDYVVQHNARVFTNTNGTANLNKLIKLCNAGGLHISVHTEFAQLDKLADKISQLSKEEGDCVVKYMLVPGKLQECKDFIDLLPSSKGSYKINVEPLVDKTNNNKIFYYTDEELEYLRLPK